MGEHILGRRERVGDREIARVSLEGHVRSGPALTGELVVELFGSGAPRDLLFDGALPQGLPRVSLFPEVGVRRLLAAPHEVEVEARTLDDTFVIRSDGEVRALLDDVRPELLRLAPLGLSLELTGERLQLTLQSPRLERLNDPVTALLALWRRLAQRALDLVHGPAA